MSIFLIAALISVSGTYMNKYWTFRAYKWLCLALVFICTLDPGRDSIIYRMTTQRIKKDN